MNTGAKGAAQSSDEGRDPAEAGANRRMSRPAVFDRIASAAAIAVGAPGASLTLGTGAGAWCLELFGPEDAAPMGPLDAVQPPSRSVPLVDPQGLVVGALSVHGRAVADWSERELETLRAIAAIAEVAIAEREEQRRPLCEALRVPM